MSSILFRFSAHGHQGMNGFVRHPSVRVAIHCRAGRKRKDWLRIALWNPVDSLLKICAPHARPMLVDIVSFATNSTA